APETDANSQHVVQHVVLPTSLFQPGTMYFKSRTFSPFCVRPAASADAWDIDLSPEWLALLNHHDHFLLLLPRSPPPARLIMPPSSPSSSLKSSSPPHPAPSPAPQTLLPSSRSPSSILPSAHLIVLRDLS